MSEAETSALKPVALAHAAPFRLGALDVSPATRSVRRGEASEALEPRVMQVLVALRRAQGAVLSRDDLIAACWDGRVVGDNAVHRTISRLRELTSGIAAGCFGIETVAKVGYRLTEGAAVRDQPAAGEQRTGSAPAPTGSRAPPAWRRRVWLWPICAMLLAGAAIATWRLIESAAPPPGAGGVALSAFAFDPRDPALAEIAHRAESALTESLAGAGFAPLARQAAASPNRAEFAIGGTVRRVDDRLLMDVTIDQRDGARLWSARFERGVAEARGLDERVAQVVARDLALAIDLRRSAPHGLSAPQMALLLRACDTVLKGTPEQTEATARLVSAAPDFAGAYALRALALAQFDETVDDRETERAIEAQTRAAARRALALDSGMALAWTALGFPIGAAPRYAEREAAFQRALSVRPDFQLARARYMLLLRETGRIDAATELAGRIQEPFPQLGLLYAVQGDWPEAKAVFQRIGALQGPGAGADAAWQAAFWWGDADTLDAQTLRLGQTRQNVYEARCLEAFRIALEATSRPLRGLPRPCADLSSDALPADIRIRLLAREGDIDGAYAEIERSPLPHSRQGTMFLFYPETRGFRHDARFAGLVARLGLRDYWLASGHWPDFCRDDPENSACWTSKS